jgi:hypothetical protein
MARRDASLSRIDLADKGSAYLELVPTTDGSAMHPMAVILVFPRGGTDAGVDRFPPLPAKTGAGERGD